MGSKGLETILHDFSGVITKAYRAREKLKKQRDPRDRLYRDVEDLIYYDDVGLVWFSGGEGPSVKPIGRPDDYGMIRDNPTLLRKFIVSLLDRGLISYGVPGVVNTSGNFDPGEYVVWMYKHSEHMPFRKSVESVVLELLAEQFSRKFAPHDTGVARDIVGEQHKRLYAGDVDAFLSARFPSDNHHDIISRLGLDDANRPSQQEQKQAMRFRRWLYRVIKETERPITLTEVLAEYAGKPEDLRESYRKGNFKNILVAHLIELSLDAKLRIQEFYLSDAARVHANASYAPQFDRLFGLLHIIAQAGSPSNGFRAASNLLESRISGGFMKDAPVFRRPYGSSATLYEELLQALAVVQKGDQLRPFWHEHAISESTAHAVGFSLYGLLQTFPVKSKRDGLIELLRIHQQRRKERRLIRPGPYCSPNDLELGYIAFHVMDHHGKKGSHSWLDDISTDSERSMIYVINERIFEVGKIRYECTVYSPVGISSAQAVYDIKDNKVTGDSSLEVAVLRDVQNDLPLAPGVRLTGFKVHRLTEGRKYIVSTGIPGWYEGVVALNRVFFPFLSSPDAQACIYGRPLLELPNQGNADSISLSKLNLRLSASDVMPLEGCGAYIDAQVRRLNRGHKPYGPLHTLYRRVNRNLQSNLTAAVEAKLADFK